MYSCSDSALLLFDKYEGKVGIAAGRSRGGGAAEVRGQQSHLLGMGAHHVVSQINVAAYSLARRGWRKVGALLGLATKRGDSSGIL